MAYIQTIERGCPHCGADDREIVAKGLDFEYRTCENEFTFVSCKKCKLVYLNPIPRPELIGDVYPSNYKPFHFHKKKDNFILKVRNILDRRKASFYRDLLPEKARILDVGCGDGRYLKILGEVGPDNWQLEGVDFGETAVKRARERGLNVIQGEYETLDLGESKYDLIILNQVIEHFIEPAAMVEKLHRELKKGGYLNIETPSLDGWDAYIFKKSFWGGYHFPRHITLFNEETVKGFFESRGFKINRIRYMLSPVFWVFSWHHFWENKVGVGTNLFSDANPIMLGVATVLDIAQRVIRGKTSNIQVVFRKI